MAVVLAFFFVLNREEVVWILWPLPYEIPLAMFIPSLVFLLIGFMMAWMGSVAWRLRYAAKLDEVARTRSVQKRAVADAKKARATGGFGEENPKSFTGTGNGKNLV